MSRSLSISSPRKDSTVSRHISIRVDEQIAPSTVTGLNRMRLAKYNKGLAFSQHERQTLGINGMLPPAVRTDSEQIKLAVANVNRLESNLEKYLYLRRLRNRNERLFYKVIDYDVCNILPLIYTPTVGIACENYSMNYEYPVGMFITIYDRGHVYDIMRNWPERNVQAIVVTDGERILGLGDLGANGMGIPVGKLTLYTALAGIRPHLCLPICLDVGTNTEKILADETYIGIKQKRATGKLYDEFIQEFMEGVVLNFGRNCLIQFEDFGNTNAFRLLDKYRHSHCMFNDDIQGTSAVVLAGCIAGMKATGMRLSDHTILFQGAGEAAIGTANLMVMYMVTEGKEIADARRRIWMVDTKGLLVRNRPKKGLTKDKEPFAHEHAVVDSLEDAVDILKPTILIGASAVRNAFTPAILQLMAKHTKHPIILALSNPLSKCECTAEDAYRYTDGRCYFAAGSQFDPVEFRSKKFFPGQCNNAFIFPGVALGVISCKATIVPDEIFLHASVRLASMVTKADMERGTLFPPMTNIQSCSQQIACEVMDYCYKHNLACLRPPPPDNMMYIQSQSYELTYPNALPDVYFYPQTNLSGGSYSARTSPSRSMGGRISYKQ